MSSEQTHALPYWLRAQAECAIEIALATQDSQPLPQEYLDTLDGSSRASILEELSLLLRLAAVKHREELGAKVEDQSA